ncbi:MAG: FtsX-like permease family protein [Myxococcaceae bacterium]|nr:FtsX-like permease family protein [Myxococcaceae bacterium]
MLQLLRLVSLRHLSLSPLRTVLTIMGVAVGVATLIGIAAINRAVMGAFRSTIDTIAGKADLSISAGQAGFPEDVLEKVSKLPGVQHAAGSITVVAPVKGTPGERLYVMGVDLLDDGFFRNYEGADRDVGHMSDDLEFLNSTDRMLVSERFAASHGLKAGGTFQLVTPTGTQDFIVHGLLKETGPIKAFGGLVGVMYIGSAQVAFTRERMLDRIDVGVDPKVGTDAVKEALQAALGVQYEVARPDRRGQSTETMVRSFQLGLNLGSSVALLVGVFLVYNTVAIGVVQRRREIGVLRALGATKRRIRALFALEAVVLGALGSLLGIPLGTLLAKGTVSAVSDSISSIYVQVNATSVTFTPFEMIVGVALGIGGSLFAALRPAFVASQVQPVEALRKDMASGAANVSSFATIVGALLIAGVWPATRIPAPIENFPVGGYLAMFFILMGTTLLSPLVLRVLQRVYQRPGELALGVPGRLAADNFARAPARTAVPVSALAIGVAMTVCIAGFVGSFQKSSEKWIDQSVPADLFVTSSSKVAGVQNVPLKPEFGDPIEQMPEVAAVDRLRIYQHDLLGLRIFIVSLNPDIYNLHGKPEVREGRLPTHEMRQQGYVTISENLSRRRNLHPESTFEMDTPTGRRSYKVSGVITDYTSDQGTVFMDRKIFVAQFNDDRVDNFEIYLKDPKTTEQVRDRINAQWKDEYDLFVLSNQELRQEAYALVDNAFSVTYAMEFLAVILALLGVINTLLAAVLDRTREIGLLRAVGAARKHIVRLFAGEAALIGLTGGVIGSLSGYVLGYIVTKVVGVEATGWDFAYIFPLKLAVQMLLAATACAIIAGLYPARRASRLDVVEALAYE